MARITQYKYKNKYKYKNNLSKSEGGTTKVPVIDQ